MTKSERKGWAARLIMGLLGVCLVASGTRTMVLGLDRPNSLPLHYDNWMHQPVFAPFAIVFGCVVLLAATFNIKSFFTQPVVKYLQSRRHRHHAHRPHEHLRRRPRSLNKR